MTKRVQRRPALGLVLLLVLSWLAWNRWGRRPPPPAPVAAVPTTPVVAVPAYRLAIVLDDWGYQKKPLDTLGQMPGPLTLSVIPRLAYSQLVAERGAALGEEIILHYPMQAQHGGHPEPGMLKPGMDALQVRSDLEQAFLTVPGAVGLNNHEGSLATEDRKLMDEVAAVLKDRDAYFLDSVTTPHSAIPAAAKAAGIPWAARRVFLDDVNQVPAILNQLKQAVDLTRRNGHCIAIGHPRPATLKALLQALPGLKEQGIQLVKVSDLLQRP